jgi:hypothetical protein
MAEGRLLFQHPIVQGEPSAASTLIVGVVDPREFRDTPRHKEVSHEQEVYRPAVG